MRRRAPLVLQRERAQVARAVELERRELVREREMQQAQQRQELVWEAWRY